MKIKYLGTGAAEGWPGIFCGCEYCKNARENGGKDIRTRSSVLINDSVMVDFPPDTYYHAITFGIDLSRLNHLVITHSHGDHFYPGDLQLRRSVFAHLDENNILEIYGNWEVGTIMEELLSDSHDLEEYIKFSLVSPFETFQAGDIRVTPLLALHDRSEDCYIYTFEDKKGKSILYGNDTGIFPEATWEYITGIHFDLVSLDCTMGPSSDGDNHMGIPDNIKVKERLFKIGCADDSTRFILTHFSHNGGLLHDELVQSAKPYGFDVAYDGFEILL